MDTGTRQSGILKRAVEKEYYMKEGKEWIRKDRQSSKEPSGKNENRYLPDTEE